MTQTSTNQPVKMTATRRAVASVELMPLEQRRLLAAGPTGSAFDAASTFVASDGTLHAVYVDAGQNLVHQTLADDASGVDGWSDKAILDDTGRMVGSMMVLDVPDRATFDDWYAKEPYVTGDVWRQVTVSPCRPGPAFVASAS